MLATGRRVRQQLGRPSHLRVRRGQHSPQERLLTGQASRQYGVAAGDGPSLLGCRDDDRRAEHTERGGDDVAGNLTQAGPTTSDVRDGVRSSDTVGFAAARTEPDGFERGVYFRSEVDTGGQRLDQVP